LGGKTFVTRLLVMVQFSVTVFLIMATVVLSRQLKYILSKDLGYDREGVVVINTFERLDYKINHQIFTIFSTEAESLPHIKEISGCVFPLSSEIGSGKITYNDKRLDFNFTSVHYNFFDTMGIKFIAGEDFTLQHPPDPEPIIVTESFVKAFEIENPVGTVLDVGSKIVGVVEDIHFWNLKQEIKPTIILLDRRTGPRNLLVRVDTSDMSRAIGSLEKIWKKAQPDKPFDYSFEDDIFQSKYEEEKRWNGIVFFSSFFAILISCMGLIGITALAISRRIKEIGIRRILGAPVLRICRLLTTEYLILVAASNLIAWPMGYYVMSRWLNGYAYRTHFDAGVFALTGALTVIIAMGTIGFFVIKAATADPVESLRYE
jgi:ABC-type antimicrobial peptide transport system permease subunit